MRATHLRLIRNFYRKSKRINPKHIRLKDITCKRKKYWDSNYYYATQRSVSGPRVLDNYVLLVKGSIPPEIKVVGNKIVDGHHRYLAGIIFGKIPETRPYILPPSAIIYKWEHVSVSSENWIF